MIILNELRHLYLGMVKMRLVVIGGGAAGYFCAVNAARLNPNLEVTILEKNSKVLQKVKVSGGGRCNVTHYGKSKAEMLKCYPRGAKLVKAVYRQFFVDDTIAWFKERGVQLVPEADGRMFPISNSSQSIIDCLQAEAEKYNVVLKIGQPVLGIKPVENGWDIILKDKALHSNYVVVASGGFAKKEQFNWITQFTQHSIINPVPSLFTFNAPKHSLTKIPGIAVPDVEIKIAGTKISTRGIVLTTHWGLSGPAILKCSAMAAFHLAETNYNYNVLINWLPQYNENDLLKHIRQYRDQKTNQKIVNSQWITLPERLKELIVLEAGGTTETTWGQATGVLQNKLAKLLCSYNMQAQGKTTYKEEFVSAGGISTSEVNNANMESNLHPGLFFAGEILNVDGITGGFNFQHAWGSAYCAANYIASH